jgi:hypothetical protein
MNKFKVIEGTVWEITAPTLGEAQAIYNAYFTGVYDDLPMEEIEASAYWHGEEFKEGAQYALEYLSDLYDGIEETDIWADYMTEGAAE